MGCKISKPAGGRDTLNQVSEGGRQASDILSFGLANLASVLALVNTAFIKDEPTRKEILTTISVLNTASVATRALGDVFEYTKDFKLISDDEIPDINGNGILDWHEILASVSRDLCGTISVFSEGIKAVLEDLIARDLGTPQQKQSIEDAKKVITTYVDPLINTLRTLLGDVKTTAMPRGMLTASIMAEKNNANKTELVEGGPSNDATISATNDLNKDGPSNDAVTHANTLTIG